MTNISQSSVRKVLLPVALLAFIAGCGPNDGLQELAEGRAAYQAGDFKKATKFLTKSAELNPINVDAFVSLALLKLESGELADAQSWIGKAEALAAGDTDVRLLSAQIAYHGKDYEKASKLFRGIGEDTTLEPSVQADGWTGLGIVQMENNEHDLARISFLRAIRIDRRHAPARYHLGHLYRYSPFGYAEAALEQFEIFVRLSGELATPRVQKTQQAIIPGLKETINRAATERPGASQRNSAASATALTKAEAAAKKGNWKAARTAYQEAVTADVLSYPAVVGLARAELKVDPSVAGQKKALERYRQACTLRPSAISTLLEAGRLAEKLVLTVQAREIYSRALAANPSSLEAVDGLIRSIRKANGDKKVAQAYQSYRDMLSTKK